MLTVLGPSGCGKTTVLRLIAGLDTPDSGPSRSAGGGWPVPGPPIPPERRRVGMVFQDVALFPHLSVRDNIGYGLRKDPDRAVRISELLELIDLPDAGGRMPHHLSGGMQQRVAVARALAPRPDVVLLDEPFSSLDAALRTQLRGDVREILRTAGTASVFVTHDQDEALTLGDRMAVMVRGHVEQVGPPEVVYGEPATPFVATFVGTANLVHGRIARAWRSPAWGPCASSAGTAPRAAPAVSSSCVRSTSTWRRLRMDRRMPGLARPAAAVHRDRDPVRGHRGRWRAPLGGGRARRPTIACRRRGDAASPRCRDGRLRERTRPGADRRARCPEARRGCRPASPLVGRGSLSRTSPIRSIVSRSNGSRKTKMTSPTPSRR